MSSGGNGTNGSSGDSDGEIEAMQPYELPAPPPEVAELAEACVTYVERETKIRLDFTPETLPLLDHWLRQRRNDLGLSKDEILGLIAAPAGAYLGEVARRALRLGWFAPPGEYRRWRIELEDVFLSMNPIGAAMEALLLHEAEGWGAAFRMRPDDEAHAKQLLDEMPEVEEDEYYAPSSRLETLEMIAVSLQRKQIANATEGAPRPHYGPSDYGPIRAEGIAAAISGKVGDN
jgi:hypothetical protein